MAGAQSHQAGRLHKGRDEDHPEGKDADADIQDFQIAVVSCLYTVDESVPTFAPDLNAVDCANSFSFLRFFVLNLYL